MSEQEMMGYLSNRDTDKNKYVVVCRRVRTSDSVFIASMLSYAGDTLSPPFPTLVSEEKKVRKISHRLQTEI